MIGFKVTVGQAILLTVDKKMWLALRLAQMMRLDVQKQSTLRWSRIASDVNAPQLRHPDCSNLLKLLNNSTITTMDKCNKNKCDKQHNKVDLKKLIRPAFRTCISQGGKKYLKHIVHKSSVTWYKAQQLQVV